MLTEVRFKNWQGVFKLQTFVFLTFRKPLLSVFVREDKLGVVLAKYAANV